jgi:hypothetical protein
MHSKQFQISWKNYNMMPSSIFHAQLLKTKETHETASRQHSSLHKRKKGKQEESAYTDGEEASTIGRDASLNPTKSP